ncbi:phosphoribosyltransferase [Vulcanisaeta moutnovskia 768-28]|uniref:Phosphoribosyltransferase n=1 Tax=Vulcanisaeta moutnovskia (strain 768-28) TaxID=985053 RepID=F0QVX3_VULM7|nr:phosphoribosyltransferase family protein [Vulcanisaeta moutnovskia]ADY02147.1 phosphoribosyltransferase [Vulcanisaeta moutnovskia 768-28]
MLATYKRVIKYDGRMVHPIEIMGLKRELPVVYIGYVTINNERFGAYIASDADLVLGDTEFIGVISEELARLIGPFNPDVIVAPEAKSVALAYGVSKKLGINHFIIVRKDTKTYMSDYISVDVSSITTRKPQRLVLDSVSTMRLRGRRVCLLDDVISTGSTMRTLERLIKIVNANIICKAVIWVEGPWIDEHEFQYIGELPIFIE